MTTLPIDSAVSPWATGLGHLALIPFVLGAGTVLLGRGALQPIALQMLSTYAAVVVSFVGAIHWGLAFPQRSAARSLWWWGVLPSLFAWAAVSIAPKPGLAVHAATLLMCFAVDRRVYPREGVARWLPLRGRLTAVAVLCCSTGAFA